MNFRITRSMKNDPRQEQLSERYLSPIDDTVNPNIASKYEYKKTSIVEILWQMEYLFWGEYKVSYF